MVKPRPHTPGIAGSIDPAMALAQVRAQWGGKAPLWVFAYASLLWRPEFDVAEQSLARVQGWHRALQMWSRVNRGTPAQPGLVFALLRGGSCWGVVQRVPTAQANDVLERLWSREMPTGVYEPRWLRCETETGSVQALAFTLPHSSLQNTGRLPTDHYQRIFSDTVGGRFGTTLDYAQQTYERLLELGIHDQALADLLHLAP
jgi:cation transport protein ChaC